MPKEHMTTCVQFFFFFFKPRRHILKVSTDSLKLQSHSKEWLDKSNVVLKRVRWGESRQEKTGNETRDAAVEKGWES
jgi:hypothetical protein